MNNKLQVKNAFRNLLSDDEFSFFCSVYDNLQKEYTKALVKDCCPSVESETVDIGQVLECAIYLSTLKFGAFVEQAWLMAQEMVSMLCFLYPRNDEVKYFSAMVLSNIKNYKGASIVDASFRNPDLLERVAEVIDKETLAFPNTSDGYFFVPQKTVFDRLEERFFSFSAPTSLGKSFILKMFIKSKVQENRNYNFAFLVPSRALINENSRDFTKILGNLLHERNYRIVENSGAAALNHDNNLICVMTPERFHYLLMQRNDLHFDYVFIDEAHKITAKDNRSALYFHIVNLLSSDTHIVFASPHIPNPDEYLKLIKAEKNRGAHSFVTHYSPVCQLKTIVDLTSNAVLSYNGHSKTVSDVCEILPGETLASIVNKIGRGKQNIIYINGKDEVVKQAFEFSQGFDSLDDPELNKLADDIETIIHDKFHLAELIRKGIAYHIGYIPSIIRMRVEELFRGSEGKPGKIHTVFCTSTLLEGVNLPCVNLFIADTKKGVDCKNMSDLDFRNLIGRAGRIGYNVSGNVILVCRKGRAAQNTYYEMLARPIKPQRLSSLYSLTDDQKRCIAESIKNGTYSIPDDSDLSADEYSNIRKFATILLKDIIAGRNTFLLRQFTDYFSSGDLEVIRERFVDRRSEIDEDINIMQDQHDRLVAAILEDPTLKYPIAYPRYTLNSKQTIMPFLEKLLRIFEWDKYEKDTLGKWNAEYKCYKQLSRYALILSKWIAGKSIKDIIQDQLIHYNKTTVEEINREAGNLLDTLERIIQFKLGNYFRKFSREYRRLRPNEPFQDWYDFIEYGGCDPKQLFLQKNGFTREVAIKISIDYKNYLRRYSLDGQECWTINSHIFSVKDEYVLNEANQVWKNDPDLFDGSPL